MRVLLLSTFLLLVASIAAAQERAIEEAAFNRTLKDSFNALDPWRAKGFRRRMHVSYRSPSHSYTLDSQHEFAAGGSSRSIYNEHVQGSPARPTREVIGVENTIYLRDVDRSNWYARTQLNRQESDRHKAYLPDTEGLQAVRDHYAKSLFDVTATEVVHKVVGTETIDGQPVELYQKAERIFGTENVNGCLMETIAVATYWVRRDGIIVKSESVSTGRIGNAEFYLRIVTVWELDPSIRIIAPQVRSS